MNRFRLGGVFASWRLGLLAGLLAVAACTDRLRLTDDSGQRVDVEVLGDLEDAAVDLGTQQSPVNKNLAREAAEHAQWLRQNIAQTAPPEYLETLVLSVRLLAQAAEIAAAEPEAAERILQGVVDDLRIKRSDAVQNGLPRLVPVDVRIDGSQAAAAGWQVAWAWQPGLELEQRETGDPSTPALGAESPNELPPGVYVFFAHQEQAGERLTTERTVAPVVSQGSEPVLIQLTLPEPAAGENP